MTTVFIQLPTGTPGGVPFTAELTAYLIPVLANQGKIEKATLELRSDLSDKSVLVGVGEKTDLVGDREVLGAIDAATTLQTDFTPIAPKSNEDLVQLYEELRNEYFDIERRSNIDIGNGDASTAYGLMGNIPRLPDIKSLAKWPNIHRTHNAALHRFLGRVVAIAVFDNTPRLYWEGIGIKEETDSEGHANVHMEALHTEIGGPWRLGLQHAPGIPRMCLHADKQATTSMVLWEIDTGRTRSRTVGTGLIRQSYGWDVAFGAAARRHVVPYRGTFPPRVREPLGDWTRRMHNRDKLAAAKATDSWIPWVLAYAHSVGISQGRIVDTLSVPTRKRFSSLAALQTEALDSWKKRKVLPENYNWRMGDQDLIDRLLNGMCPHPPAVETGADGNARLVWRFTWQNEAGDPAQTGIHHLDYDPAELEAARMPDITVFSTWAVLSSQDDGPLLLGDAPLLPSEIHLQWPGQEPTVVPRPAQDASHSPTTPSAGDFTNAWEFAKWFVRQAILVSGQIDWHLGRCHVFMEQICATLCANLRSIRWTEQQGADHPLLNHLWPFIRSADEINAFGDLTLLSRDGILSTATCLAPEAVVLRMRRQRATWNWATYTHRLRKDGRPLCKEDDFGAWSAAAMKACHAWASHIPDADLADLCGTSLGDSVSGALAKLQKDHVGQTEKPQSWWGSGGRDPTTDDSPVDLTVPTLRTKDDWRELAAFLVYVSSFLHAWVGGAQMADMGNVYVASVGHRWNALPTNAPSFFAATDTRKWAQDEWEARGPLPDHAGFAVALAELIGTQDWGRLVYAESEKETFRDTSTPTIDETPQIGALLAEYRAHISSVPASARRRFPIEKLRSRINI